MPKFGVLVSRCISFHRVPDCGWVCKPSVLSGKTIWHFKWQVMHWKRNRVLLCYFCDE